MISALLALPRAPRSPGGRRSASSRAPAVRGRAILVGQFEDVDPAVAGDEEPNGVRVCRVAPTSNLGDDLAQGSSCTDDVGDPVEVPIQQDTRDRDVGTDNDLADWVGRQSLARGDDSADVACRRRCPASRWPRL